MIQPKHPLQTWLSEIFYEDNPRFGRRASRVFGLLWKTVMAIPQAIAFTFCNFASTYPPAQSTPEPTPLAPSPVARLVIDDWPRRADGGERGLPYSDSVVERVSAGDSLARVTDLIFAMREIHRVCRNGATIEIAVSDSMDDPTAVRRVTPEILHFFSAGPQRAQTLGVARLFDVSRSDGASLTLAVKKSPSPGAQPARIDLGSGSIPRDGYAGVDVLPLPGVAIVRDIERHGLPFSDSTISHVYTAHFLEHVRDLIFVMNEIHRVCCHDALVEISVPTLLGPYAAADPTHVRLFNARTLSYFEAGTDAYAGIDKGFEILEQHVGVSLRALLRVVKDPSGSRSA